MADEAYVPHSMAPPIPAAPSSRDAPGERERHAVLDVFGLTLEVTNPRLADLLKMDARAALNTDLRGLSQPGDPAAIAPNGTMAPNGATAADTTGVVIPAAPAMNDEEADHRRRFRHSVQDVGTHLGFEARADGLWQSPTGVVLLTRSIERPVSFAAANHYVSELAARRESIAGPESTALFVVDGQTTVDVFKVAIRQGRLYDLMRTISLDNLLAIRELYSSGVLDHSRAVALLVPVANIDVGEVISIVRSAKAGSLPDALSAEEPAL